MKFKKTNKLHHAATMARLTKRTPFRLLYNRRVKQMRALLNEEDVIQMVERMYALQDKVDVLEQLVEGSDDGKRQT